ncbi:hypothetical protein C8Q77DRAFT_19016 [Trametes polyzona]|nr:hypothetical protein C8Q77DRAFT_19016 [Trametes polyzona]
MDGVPRRRRRLRTVAGLRHRRSLSATALHRQPFLAYAALRTSARVVHLGLPTSSRLYLASALSRFRKNAFLPLPADLSQRPFVYYKPLCKVYVITLKKYRPRARNLTLWTHITTLRSRSFRRVRPLASIITHARTFPLSLLPLPLLSPIPSPCTNSTVCSCACVPRVLCSYGHLSGPGSSLRLCERRRRLTGRAWLWIPPAGAGLQIMRHDLPAERSCYDGQYRSQAEAGIGATDFVFAGGRGTCVATARCAYRPEDQKMDL